MSKKHLRSRIANQDIKSDQTLISTNWYKIKCHVQDREAKNDTPSRGTTPSTGPIKDVPHPPPSTPRRRTNDRSIQRSHASITENNLKTGGELGHLLDSYVTRVLRGSLMSKKSYILVTKM